MEEAERIAREEHGSIKLAVISGNHWNWNCMFGKELTVLSSQASVPETITANWDTNSMGHTWASHWY